MRTRLSREQLFSESRQVEKQDSVAATNLIYYYDKKNDVSITFFRFTLFILEPVIHLDTLSINEPKLASVFVSSTIIYLRINSQVI